MKGYKLESTFFYPSQQTDNIKLQIYWLFGKMILSFVYKNEI